MRVQMIAVRMAAVLCAGMVSGASVAQVAAHPPMGWNSWDAYGLTITEAQFRANVDVEARTLKPFGWTYAVIDEGWFLKNPLDRPTPEKLHYSIDGFGRYVPVAARFPSSPAGGTTSFAALGAWVHAQGLRFGIHIVRGIPRESVMRNLPVEGSAFHAADVADQSDACPWDPTNWGVRDDAAGQAWYDALLRQYAGWGVDLLKVDCIGSHPYKVSEIRMIRRAIERTGRPIVLSLSPGPMDLANAQEVAGLAQMWRISDDIWDDWTNPKPWPRSVLSQFERTAAWAAHSGPGHWPDADMLPVGELRPNPGFGDPRSTALTHDEQRTLLTLWSMARSPLILGANLTLLDGWTTALVTDRDVLRIDQTATASGQVSRDADTVVWTAELPGGERALAVFNISDSASAVDKPLSAFGLAKGVWKVRDAWTQSDIGPNARMSRSLPAHGCVLWLLRR